MRCLTQRFETEQSLIAWDVQGDGVPLVLLHGTPFSSAIWEEVAAALAHRFNR